MGKVVGRVVRADGVVVYESEGVAGVGITPRGKTVRLENVDIVVGAMLCFVIEAVADEGAQEWYITGEREGMLVNGHMFNHSGMSSIEGQGRVALTGVLPLS